MADLEALARQWFDVAHARDFDALGAMYTTDTEYVRSDGTSNGPAEMVTYLKGIIGAFPDHASRIDAVLVSGDAVTVEWYETGTHTEPFVGGWVGTIPATGKAFGERIVEVFRFRGDQIASQH